MFRRNVFSRKSKRPTKTESTLLKIALKCLYDLLA